MKIPGFLLALALSLQAAPLVVVSVDGLDNRYLRDRDALGLQIPNIRKLMREGEWANGVVGVVPTITWPSHISIVTGVRPDQHGILSNWRPSPNGKDLYLSADQIKVPTLWMIAHDRGLKTAAVTWPSTVGAAIDFNLPEYFLKRNGGGMDMESTEKKSTPGLLARIAHEFPSFPRPFLDDRERALAVVYLLRNEHPGLLLVHFVDHDADAHEYGPYTKEANATLEYTDELIGSILRAVQPGGVVAVVSDHGFERVDKVINVPALLAREGVKGDVRAMGGIAVTKDPAVAEALRKLNLGREVPHDEVLRYAPRLADAAAVFEPPDHAEFGPGSGEIYTSPPEKGNHGFWPTRHDYRSVFVLWGPGIKPQAAPEMSMLDIFPRLKALLESKSASQHEAAGERRAAQNQDMRDHGGRGGAEVQ